MRTALRGVHMALTQGLESYVQKHLVRPLARLHPGQAADLDVQLCENSPAKGRPGVECRVTLRMPSGRALHVEERGHDLYRCISFARDRMGRLAKRELERRRRAPFLAEDLARQL